jgi:hypothetical protein
MKSSPIIALCIALLACSPQEKKESSRPLVSGLLLENMDTTVRPGDSLYLAP